MRNIPNHEGNSKKVREKTSEHQVSKWRAKLKEKTQGSHYTSIIIKR